MHVFVTGGSGFLGQHLLRRLAEDGHRVRALARSTTARQRVTAAGATPVPGDLGSVTPDLLDGVDLVVHAAADTRDWVRAGGLDATNVEGTRAVVVAARGAGVPRLVHVSTEAVLADGRPIVSADEGVPLAGRPAGEYPRTKGLAERLVLGSDAPGFTTVAVRPRLIWGPGDTVVLPGVIAAAEAGRWSWVAGGHYLTSTCHVRNVCEGIVRAAEHGAGGSAYFLTDGEPVELREFLTRSAAAHGVRLPDRSMPYAVARALATGLDATWRALPLPGAPPLSRTAFALLLHEVTVDDSRARRELGYLPVISREEGLAALG